MRCLLAVVALAGLCLPLQAQTSGAWKERPYDPAPGSRWSIVSKSETIDLPADGSQRTTSIESHAELTIEEKLADGFRVSYVTRDIKVSGNAPGVDIINIAFGATKDIVVRARTDKSGMPLVVDNIDEMKVTMRTVVDQITRNFDKNPKVGAVLRQILESFFLADGVQAAKMHMEEVAALSAGQSTGLMPHVEKRVIDEVPNPVGGGMLKSTLVFKLHNWDAAGHARISRLPSPLSGSCPRRQMTISRRRCSN